MKRVFTDFHHSSLLRATNMLFGERLHMLVYRPIGMEWFEQGFWAVNNQEDTARQFLSLEQSFRPGDGTPHLNTLTMQRDKVLGETEAAGMYYVADPGGATWHRACTMDFFRDHQFDYVIASIPQHVPLYKKLIELYQPQAKLIVQMGNNWNLNDYAGHNVLASIAPQFSPANTMFYHQEFDTEIFRASQVEPHKKVFSFVNLIEHTGIGWNDYRELRKMLSPQGWEFRAYGGQCPDGNMTGPVELANKMREATFVFHVKPGGDGFGHIIHNAYAAGRPLITRSSHYRDQLAEQLLVPGTFIDLDKFGRPEVKNMLTRLLHDPEGLQAMGKRAAQRFRDVVDYEYESEGIGQWLGNLL